MNAKLCKRLRRQARAETVGREARRLVGWEQQLGPDKAERAGRRFVIGAINAADTTRGVYRELKIRARRAYG